MSGTDLRVKVAEFGLLKSSHLIIYFIYDIVEVIDTEMVRVVFYLENSS